VGFLVALMLGMFGCGSENIDETTNVAPKLAILHLSPQEFIDSINHPRYFPDMPAGRIAAGVVPHHNTAASLISGFFSRVATHADEYDLVIILGPNHFGDVASVVLSYRDWGKGSGVATCRQFAEDLMAAPGINTAICHSRMEQDHSASILIPYIYHYLPGTAVAPVLLNRSLSFNATAELFHWLNRWIYESDKNVLLVASIDFSHFLTAEQAREMDRLTADAIAQNDLRQIHEMNYHHLDCAASMIIFLMYLQEKGLAPHIVYNTDASEFLGPGIRETTSYMIIAGVEKSRVQLTFIGDLMLHQAQADAARQPGGYDFNRSFGKVRPFLQGADLTIGNLETVLAGRFVDTSAQNAPFPLFSAPDEFGYALKNAGFDLLSTANNHSLDQGEEGLLRTLDVLEGLGIGTFGTYRTQEERDRVLVREVGGMRFAFLSYTFSTNNRPIPRDYLVNILHENLIRADISAARQLADFVIVMPHMGYEYEPAPRPHIQDWAMMMLAAGADIVVAGHPHVVQPMGFVDVVDYETGATRRGFVAYCLGNFISGQRTPPTDVGVMLNLYFEHTADGTPVFTDFSYITTWVKFVDAWGIPDIMVLPIDQTLAQIDAGKDLNLRQADIRRMREARREVDGWN